MKKIATLLLVLLLIGSLFAVTAIESTTAEDLTDKGIASGAFKEPNYADESKPDGAYGAINPFHRISDSPLLRLPDDMRDWPPVVPPEPHEAVDAEDPTAMVIYNLIVLSFGYLQQEMQRLPMPENSPNSSMPHQDDPFRGTFGRSENVSLNQPAKIIFTICPIEDAPNTTIRLFLPPDIKLVEGNTEWCGDVKSDEEVQVSVVIQVPIEMRGNIKASVERPANEIKIRRSYYCLISTMKREDNVSESRRIVVEMPKQDDPFKGSFAGSQTPSLNKVAQITFSVSPEQDMPDSTIKFFLPPDVELVEGDLEWHGDLKEGQQLSLDLFIKVTEKVEQNIKAEALTYIDGIMITRSYYFPFSTVDEPDPSPIKEPDGTLIMQTMAKSISLSSQPSSVNLQKQPKSPGYITVIGKFYYVNENGGYSPMRHVYTELWDSETGPDEYLGYDYTDDDGNFYYYVNNDDGYLQDGRDVYVKGWAYSAAAKTTTDGDAQYKVLTTTKSNVPDGTVDFGSMYPTSYSEAWEAVDAAWSEYIWINSQVGWTRSRVHIKWPSGTWPCTDGDRIYLPDKDKATAGWDHVTVHHEYGHCVMWNAYGNSWPPTGYSGSHWVTLETDEGFATIEGWAEFMQCVVDNDSNNLQDWGQNIETNDWYNKQDSGDFDGDIIEGSFASILWDIFDPANDDGLNMGFDEIWTIMLNDRPGSIHDVWDGWFDRSYGHAQDLGQIYWNYGVNKLPDLTVLFPSAPASAKIGDYITVSYALSNNGLLDSGSFHTRISLATTPYGTDIELGTFSEDSVPGGSCTAGESHEVQISPDVSPGYYYVTVFADVFDDVTESDEDNNINKAPNQIHITEPPAIELTPSSHNFGNVEVGDCSGTYSFTLTNTGGGTATGSVSLTGSHASQFTITQGSGSFSLGAGATKTIKVEFCPTSTGSKSATLYADGSNCNDDSSSLSGTGTQTPSIDLSPSSHNFGSVEVSSCSQEYSFTLTNTGGGTATGSVSKTGTHASQFTITQGSGSFSLGAGASKMIKVEFCPTSTGSKSATLYADGSNCNDDLSSLSGTGTQTPSIDLSPSSHNFGSVEVSSCSPEYSFTLTNTGGGTATGSVSKTGTHASQFTITQGSGSFSLGAGASKTIKVEFCPTSTGSKSATLKAAGSNCNDDSSSLSGTGTQLPSIDLSPSSQSFGNVEVGSCSSEYSFTLTNTGGGTATGSVSLTGTHASQFTITQGSGSFSLSAGASKTIKVKFCPDSTGAKSATLYADGTNCNDDSSSLSGTGVENPELSYSPTSHNFGDKCEGETDSTLFKIGNSGSGTLTYTLSESCGWLDISPTSGSSTGEHDTITVGIDTTGLSEGPHTCDISISSNDGSGTFTVTVNVVPCEESVLSYSPTSHDFGDKCEGETDSTTFEIWNSGSGTLTYSLSETCGWVDVHPTSSSSTGEHDTITVDIDTTGLSEGSHTCDISIISNGGSGTFTVTVNVVPVAETVVSIEDTSAPQGGTVTVPINIADVENMCGANIWLNYNKNVVIADSVSDGDLVPLTHNIDNTAGVTKMNWDTTSGMTGDFVFAYVTLKAVGNPGDTCLLDLDVNELYDCDLVKIPRTVVDGTFEVIAPLMEGDVTDLNVCVSLKDSTLIKFYLVDMATLTPDQLECADTNDDGEVTLKDSTAIKFWLVDHYPLWESPADDHMMEPVPCSVMSLARAASATDSIEDAPVPAKCSLLFVAGGEPIEKKRACPCYHQKEMIGGQEKLGGNMK